MLINYLIIILAGLLLGTVFIFISKKFSLRHNVLISKGMPLVGGMGMGLSFVLVSLFSLFLLRALSRGIIGIIAASLIMLIFGIIDDWRELSISAKFLIQIIATFFLIFSGIRTQIIYIGNLLNLIITFIWVLTITNAFNHLDVVDGLASGCAMITSSSLFIIALLNGDIKIAILSLALSAATLSCFIYNFPPAKIYMGNSGSHFLGFVLAAIALGISYAPMERKIALLSPLLILGFPIFDTAFLILCRTRKARSIFKKSNDHLALRFLHLGYSKRKTLLFMLALSLFFSFSGVALSQASNILGIIIIFLVVIVGLLVTRKMGRVSIDG
jgi:UDP-GlcNAc:undecaprenyl-phosphate GlcNAc-1-phosphate transferase